MHPDIIDLIVLSWFTPAVLAGNVFTQVVERDNVEGFV
jgi:hypothetical protein